MYHQANPGGNSEFAALCIPQSFAGVFSFVLLVALPLAVLLTWFTIYLYRRKIQQAMRQTSPDLNSANTIDRSDHSAAPPSRALRLQTIHNDSSDIPATQPSIEASRALRKTSLAYVLAGLAQALVVSAFTFFLSNTEILPIRFTSTVFLYLWPVVPTLILTSVSDPRVKWGSLAGYFALLFLLDFGLIATGILQNSGPGAFVLVWLNWMGPPSVLLLILSNRAWRAVGLLAYLVALALVAGWLLATQGLACLTLFSNNIAVWKLYYWPVLIGGLLITGAFAWWILRRIARRYQKKQSSDLSLTLASWWLVITLVEVVIQFDATAGKSVSFLLGYWLYLWISRSLTGGLNRSSSSSLLLLRVFGHRRRSRQLLDQLSQRWRFLGPISLIGAPDLAATNLEPNELIQFWGGHTRQLFVANHDDLHNRLTGFDEQMDSDGRFRVNEFFCYDNTWRDTVQALANKSDVILMDLRGFGSQNRGCEFELGMLINYVPLSKTVLLVDSSSDQKLLQNLLQKLWLQLAESSPNRQAQLPVVRIFSASGPLRSVRPLLSLLSDFRYGFYSRTAS